MIKDNKIPILVVLFCPEQSVIARLIELQKSVNLFVYDNSPKLSHSDLTSLLKYYYLDSSNSGISGAMRWMVQQCTTNKLTNFIFLDQDTIISENAIHQINEVLNSQDQHVNICHFTSEFKSIPPRFVINSGTLFNVNFLIKHSRILEAYFVDGIDLALSAASRRDGQHLNLHIISGIDHVSGQGFELWQIGPLKLTVKPYSAVRRQEFYRSHRRLVLELLSHFQFFDAIIVFKFTFAFWLGQFKYDLCKHFGHKL
jgi:hypothetical protein